MRIDRARLATAPAPGQGAVSRARPGQAALLVAGVALATVPVAFVVAHGPSAINLDTLLEQPLRFWGLFLTPLALSLTCALGAVLPRTLSINVLVLAGLLGLAEVAAWVLTPAPVPLQGEPEVTGGSTFYVPHPVLGYTLAVATEARHRRTMQDTVIYDVVYRTDARGRRDTPVSPAPRQSYLALLGDSNVFGEGLPQTGTLAYHAGVLAPAYRPYNYGVPGYGPGTLLALARLGRLRQDLVDGDGYVVAFVIPAHVARAIGSARVSTTWGRHFPYYRLDAHETLVSDGDFVHARPVTTLAYYLLTRTNLLAYAGMDLPPWYDAYDYRLTARLLSETRRTLLEQLHARDVVIVLAQVYNDAQAQVIRRLGEALTREGVSYLDYTRLFDTSDPRYRLSEFDYHNSAEANRVIATRLVADFGLDR